MRTPSAKQAEAIAHVLGPALLVAGPGSGKTFTVVSRISYLIQKEHIPPDNILVVTFSKAAAKEMQNRFLTQVETGEVQFGTFHSLAYNILRRSFGFDNQSLLSTSEKRNILANVFRNHGLESLCNAEFLNGILDQISHLKNSALYTDYSISSDSEEISSEELRLILCEYQDFVTENGKLDFDDMIILCIQKLKNNRKVLDEYRNIFRFIMVDEFQDINAPQYDLVRLLSYPNNNLFVVGDDDQAIYRFRGSTPGIMKRFLEDFEGCPLIMLTENYRSPRNIVDFSSKLIRVSKERFPKDFWAKQSGGEIRYYDLISRKDEEGRVVAILKALPEEELNDTAIILRTNREVILYSSLIRKAGIVVSEKVKSRKMSDSFITRDILSFLSFVYGGRRREDFLLIMNKPQKYIERKACIRSIVDERELVAFYQKNEQMKVVLKEFFSKIELASRLTERLAIGIFRRAIGYERYLKEISRNIDEYKGWLSELEKLEDIFSTYKAGVSYSEFLEELEEGHNATEGGSKEAGVTCGVKLLTMHMSKGLEFGNVILPDINEGVIPPKNADVRDVEEERRLLYVAITRARRSLHILNTHERNRSLSRFVKGLVEEYLVE